MFDFVFVFDFVWRQRRGTGADSVDHSLAKIPFQLSEPSETECLTSQAKQTHYPQRDSKGGAENKGLSSPVLQDSGKLSRLGRVRSACALHCTATESPCKHSAWVCLPQHLAEQSVLDWITAECPALGNREGQQGVCQTFLQGTTPPRISF